jgi:hypothetical protein
MRSLPDRQDVVALAEHRLRAVAHADCVQSGQHGDVCVNRALIKQLVAKVFRFLLRQPISVVELFDKGRRLLR